MSFSDVTAEYGLQPLQVRPASNDVHRPPQGGYLTAPRFRSVTSPACEPAATRMKTLYQGYHNVLQDWQAL